MFHQIIIILQQRYYNHLVYYFESCLIERVYHNIYYKLLLFCAMEAFQWQEPTSSTPFWIHMIAGSCAGLSQHISMLPLDNIKTHCQAGYRRKIFQLAKRIYNHGGIYNFYSGSSIVALGCIPAHAVYFSIYQKSKKLLDPQVGAGSWMYGIVGVASSLFHDIVMTPTQVIKQRLQLTRSLKNQKIGMYEMIKSMYKTQGLISFYRSFGINYLMNIPFSSIIIVANENLKHIFNVHDQGHPLSYYLCAGLAGGIASIPTIPFDVIKTKLNVQKCAKSFCEKRVLCSIINNDKMKHPTKKNQNLNRGLSRKATSVSISTKKDLIKYRTILDTTQTIFKQEGIRGFFTGLKMKIIIQSTSSAIAWGTYQSIKTLLQQSSFKQ